MCGIIGAVAERNVVPILLEGLRRLEYRGYDSSGVAIIADGTLERIRALGKVQALVNKIEQEKPSSTTGIAHTRWATHGAPSEDNAHPHISGSRLAVVHNGILENFHELRESLKKEGQVFTSETDTEVIAHVLNRNLEANGNSLLSCVQESLKMFEGAYALGIIDVHHPDSLVAVRCGSPLVVGVGIGEYFIASDPHALTPVTQSYIPLEDGDIVYIEKQHLQIFDKNGENVFDSKNQINEKRTISTIRVFSNIEGKGDYRHYMLKEIYEQPDAVTQTLQNALVGDSILTDAFGAQAPETLKSISQVTVLACGTSYYAGMVSKYWFEDILDIPVNVEIASEFRYRNPVILNNTLYVVVSQSGETADTRAALELIDEQRKIKNIPVLTICNTPDSTITRSADMVFLTHAGVEVGVASTKAFTTQLVALALLLVVIGKVQKRIQEDQEMRIAQGLRHLPSLIKRVLNCEKEIAKVATIIAEFDNALILGRGSMYPVALEGALKIKEVAYIHAEAYPAGELKHGPLALVDENTPVIVVAPHDELLAKLRSNLQEVHARGGNLIVFEDEKSNISTDGWSNVIPITSGVGRITAPIIFAIPLQLLAYHVALIRGTDIDQPRNLAKSVTVE